MPAADFCGMVRMDCSFLSHDFVTCRRSPEVSSIAFHAQPPDLHSALLMDMGFVAICQLARSPPASNPVLVHQLACLLRASFRPRLATRPLRFAITSRPSRCEEDLHLQAIDHARHTKMGAEMALRPFGFPRNIGQFGITSCCPGLMALGSLSLSRLALKIFMYSFAFP